MKDDLKVALYRFANVLLDEADRDYILARYCFQNGFCLQYVWSRSQTLEKYLKAILLYNGRSIKSYNHNIKKLYEDVISIDGMFLNEFEGMDQFVFDCEKGAHARYGTEDIYFKGDDIDKLDGTVFEIRKLCYPSIGDSLIGSFSQLKNVCQKANLRSFREKPISEIHLNSMTGYLKKVLTCDSSSRYKEQRNNLVWENKSFGQLQDVQGRNALILKFHTAPGLDGSYFGISESEIRQ
jgi:HEPN domain-containing protein